MRIVADRQALKQAVKMAARALPARAVRDVMTYIKLDARDGMVSLTGTNGENFVSADSQRVSVVRPGSVLIAGDKLVSILTETTGENIEIELLPDGRVGFKCAGATFKVSTLPVDQFPPTMTVANPPFVLTVTASEFVRMVRQITPFVAQTEARFVYSGYMLEGVSLNKCVMVSTEGRKVGIASADCSSAGTLGQILVSPTTMSHALACIDGGDGEVTIRASSAIEIKADGVSVVGSLMECPKLPYRDIVPKDHGKTLVVPTASFITALKQARLLANESTKGVLFSLSSAKCLVSSVRSEEETDSVIEGAEYTGEPLEVCFNPDMLLDAVKNISDEKVVAQFQAPNRPVRIDATGFVGIVQAISKES